MKEYYVYMHKSIQTNRIFYIGKGHGKRAWDKCGRSVYWNSLVAKEGYVVTIAEKDLTEEEAYLVEKRLIAKYGKHQDGGTLVNFTDGGEGRSGFTWNGQRIGENNPMYGKKQSTQAKQLIAQTKKGKTRPPELMAKLAESNRQRPKELHNRYGKTHTMETKRKMSLAGKGRQKPVKTILDTQTGIFYLGWLELANCLGLKVHQVEYLRRNSKLTKYIIT